MSFDHATAIDEFHQDIVRPGTLTAYDVSSDAMKDLTGIGVDPAISLCQWKTIYQIERQTPPTWMLADEWIASGAHGAVVPSARRRGANNLVLWRWGSDSNNGAEVTVIDPRREL